MHGRDREKYKSRLRDPTTSTAIAQKAQQLSLLSKELLLRRGRLSPPTSKHPPPNDIAVVDEETLQLTEKILLINPDPSHLWNHRRELLAGLQKSYTYDGVLMTELRLTAQCLRKNPKAYAAWMHRKYVMSQFAIETSATAPGETTAVLEAELNLCSEFLEADERNFHCWNYRRFIAAALAWTSSLSSSPTAISPPPLNGSCLCGPSLFGAQLLPSSSSFSSTMTPPFPPATLLSSEWTFTTNKIQTNFSNYSAFHYRSQMLPSTLADDKYGTVLEVIREELNLVRNATFTEPDDQTAWWYHHFLLVWSDPLRYDRDDKSLMEKNVQQYLKLLQEDAEIIRELLEAEEGKCKWGLLGLHTSLSRWVSSSSQLGVAEEEVGERTEEARRCLVTLMEIDPDRKRRYECMMKDLDR